MDVLQRLAELVVSAVAEDTLFVGSLCVVAWVYSRSLYWPGYLTVIIYIYLFFFYVYRTVVLRSFKHNQAFTGPISQRGTSGADTGGNRAVLVVYCVELSALVSVRFNGALFP